MSEILIDNIKVAAHNHYLVGRQHWQIAPPNESDAARSNRVLKAQAHVAKAERTMLELQTWVQEKVTSAESQLARLHETEGATDLDKQDQAYQVRWVRKYNQQYVVDLRARFVGGGTGLLDALVPIAGRTAADFNNFVKELFSNRDRIFSVYAAFELCNHMAYVTSSTIVYVPSC